MRILGIDTCCAPASAAVYDSGLITGEVTLNCGKTHSQRIMPMIDEMLGGLGLEPSDMDAFAAAVGPGSFTGVRIGAATIKAMAHACGKPCVAVSSLEALAQNIKYFGGIICPIIDARRDNVYAAVFRGITRERLADDKLVNIDKLVTKLSGEKIMFLGDGVLVHRKRIEAILGHGAVFADADKLMNSAASVAQIAAEKYERGETIGYSELVPNYVRLSQAEREKQKNSALDN